MSEQFRESMSAVMDDEADAFELRRVLDEASADESLREQWHRMHVLRDVMRKQSNQYAPELRDRIWAELNNTEEAAEQNPVQLVSAAGGGPRKANWTGRLTGTAVAAAVALVVVFSGDSLFEQPTTDLATNVQAIPAVAAPAPLPVMYDQATESDRQRLDALRMHHYQHSALNRPGGVSFVRMATFDRTRAPVQTAPGVVPVQPPTSQSPRQ